MATTQAFTALRHLRSLIAVQESAELSDADLLRRFVAHQAEDAFAALVRRHGRLVWSVCRHVLGHEQDAEDAFQATFLVLARKAGTIRKGEALASWLHGTAHRVALRAKRDAAIRRAHERRGRTMPAERSIPDTVLCEALALLDEEVQHLPDRQRAVFVQCCLEGKSLAEAAQHLGWKEGTVSGTLARARQQLRQRLMRRGITLTAILAAVALGRDSRAAAVPAGLVQTTAQAALGYGTTRATTAAATALAETVSRALGIARTRTVMGFLLLLGLAVTGTGLLASRSLSSNEGVAEQMEPASPPETGETRQDCFGDPLPPGALARLGTQRLRHAGRIYSLAVSPDGRCLASRGLDGVVHLWDVATGMERTHFHLASTGPWTNTVALSPDGKRLFTATGPGGTDNSVTAWDVSTSQEVLRLRVKEGRVSTVAISPDGKTVAEVTRSSIRLWDALTGMELHELTGHGEEIEQIAFAPDGKTLGSGSRDRTIRLWDVATGATVRMLEGKLALVPDEIDLGGGRKFVGRQRGVVAMTFSPDGRTLAAAASADGAFRVWDTNSGKELPPFPGALLQITTLAYLPDGRTIVSGDWDGTIRVWDVASRKVLRRFRAHHGPILALALFRDGKTLAAGGERTIRLWDVAEGTEILPLEAHHQAVTHLVFAPDGRTVASGSGDGTGAVCLWDPATGRLLRHLDGPGGKVGLLAFAADGRSLAVGGRWSPTVHRWDPATGQDLGLRTYGERSLFLPAPNGTILAGMDSPGTITLWDMATAREVRRLPVRCRSGAVLSPDGKLLACDTSDPDAMLRLWDVTTGKEVRRYQGNGYTLSAIAFSADGRYLAAAFNGAPPAVRIWDVATGVRVAECAVRSDCSFQALVFAPDSRTLASGCHDGAVRLWEVVTSQQCHCFRGHVGAVRALAYSPEGSRLVSGGEDTLGLVWDVRGPRGTCSAAELETRWTDLASSDAAASHEAIGRLVGAGNQAVAFLGDHLRPARRATPEQMARLIADMNSEAFPVREQASRNLEELGGVAESALREALAGRPSPEVRRRVEQLLEKLPVTGSTDRLRQFRALGVLEAVRTSEAQRLLERLADGAPQALLTREAHATLQRRAARPSSPP
jgi:RNA polymerase sigma factor (sigma-70 family)